MQLHASPCISVHLLFPYASLDTAPCTLSQRLQVSPSVTPLRRHTFASLVQAVYREYNERVFDGRLAADLSIRFNGRLTTTGGYCRFRGGTFGGGERYAEIDLSAKLVTSEDRLRATLAHEMCHAGQWVIDNEARPAHGKAYKRWTKVFMSRVPGMDGKDGLATIYHYYGRFLRVRYGCSRRNCRFSKAYANQSYLIEQKGCPRCGGVFRLIGKTHPDGTLVGAHESSAFVKYVQGHYGALKASNPSFSNGELMAELRRGFREEDGRSDAWAAHWASVIEAEAYGSEAEGGSGGAVGVSEDELLFAPFSGLRL